jgi:DNA polymerase bacteriophage-type
MRRLWLDSETRSRVSIRLGNVKYATQVEMTMLQYAIDDGPVTIIDMLSLRTKELRKFQIARLKAEIQRADEVWAQQAEFDRTVTEKTEVLAIAESKWRCTAALARMHGLPGGLDKLCTIFKVPERFAKLKGKDVGETFWKPNKKGEYNTPESHPKEWAEFLRYGGRDVEAMRYVWRKIPKWNATPRMWAVWALDFRMNHRGVAMDVPLAAGAVEATTRAKRRLAARTAKLSKLQVSGLEGDESALEATTQVKRLLAYMEGFGVTLPDLTADTVERRLEDESLPWHIKELLRIRQKASKASTAKYQRVLNQHVRGRLFNLLVFCGAMRTGRWAGRTLQPQNLPRPKHEKWDIERAIERFKNGTIEAYAPDDVLGLASSALRGLIVAEPGRRLVTSDYANIEGRFMAWIAGEDWKIAAYEAYDRGEGPDLYKVAYAKPFNIDPNDIADEGDWRRQVGKVMELALQYYGGVGAFCAMAETYGLRLEQLAVTAWSTIPIAIRRQSQSQWNKAVKRRRTYGLEEKVWVVCQSLVTMWRNAHPMVVAFWSALDTAVKSAIRSPGKRFTAGERISVDRVGNWLRIRLPSGRYLNYPAPRIKSDGRFTSRSFIGVDPYTKQWQRIYTYSGKDAENVCQGGCADIIMDGLLAADAAGYNPVLSVHDEAITEPPDEDKYNAKDLSRRLVKASAWAKGMPLAAKGDVSYRYKGKGIISNELLAANN